MSFIRTALLLLALYAGPCQAATMHVVLAADTQAKNIGAGAVADLYYLTQELCRIESFTGLKVEKRTFVGDDYRAVEVLDYVRNLEVNGDDVVLYYHNSHGFRTSQMHNPWPALDFGTQEALDLSDIIQAIMKKQQRLAIILADTCNKMIDDWAAPDFYKQDLAPPLSKTQQIRKYRQLFLEQNGCIIATAASPDQYAWSTPLGSFFTLSFLMAIEEHCKDRTNPVSWETILQNTRLTTQTMSGDAMQSPVYECMIGE